MTLRKLLIDLLETYRDGWDVHDGPGHLANDAGHVHGSSDGDEAHTPGGCSST